MLGSENWEENDSSWRKLRTEVNRSGHFRRANAQNSWEGRIQYRVLLCPSPVADAILKGSWRNETNQTGLCHNYAPHNLSAYFLRHQISRMWDCSFIGYDVDGSYGYVAPMCEDGYGVFYKIGPDRYGSTLNLEWNFSSVIYLLEKKLLHFLLEQSILLSFWKKAIHWWQCYVTLQH